jgi:hypothetical protein
MGEILDDPTKVQGVIYLISHTASSKKYVGQTLTHRLNHGRYRPFGAEGRFRDHLNTAIKNTKGKQCTYLYNAIRLYGREAFTVSVLEVCDRSVLDEREKHHITAQNALFPHGYNLTTGGRGTLYIAAIPNDTPLNPKGKHGGSKFRSAETRQKMSERGKEVCSDPVKRTKRATNAKAQHLAGKLSRFEGITVDPARIEEYIHMRKGRIVVDVSGTTTTFAGKSESENSLRDRAREFLRNLVPATLPNCSGNP